MKKLMDKTISEYEGQLLNVNRQMLSGFEEKLFLEKLDVTKNMDLPFSCGRIFGDKDWLTINVKNKNFILLSIKYILVCD